MPKRELSWQSLVEYALGCVEYESVAATVNLRPRDGDKPWFHINEPEQLVTGRENCIEATKEVAQHLDRLATAGDMAQEPPALMCGWPSIVTWHSEHPGEQQRRRKQIAPLLVCRLECEKVDGVWELTASHEADFNIAALAGGREGADKASEVRDIELPYGDAAGMVQAAMKAAELLGYDPVQIDPDNLSELDNDATAGQIHNAAVILEAENFRPYHFWMKKDLEELRHQDDWQETAAAWLVGVKEGEDNKPTTPLAAPLAVNASLEEALNSARTSPLTVVTGPPGTGKTQFVVNAVANAWLDGERVLMASTNNAAVDVASERSAREVAHGLLMRTGNKSIQQQLAQQVSVVCSMYRKRAKGSEVRTIEAVQELAKASGARTKRLGEIITLDGLDKKLLEQHQKIDEAQRNLIEATPAMRKTGAKIDKIREASNELSAEFWNLYRRLQNIRDDDESSGEKEIKLQSKRENQSFERLEVEAIQNKAELLTRAGVLSFMRRRQLCAKLGCPKNTKMRHILKWTQSWLTENAATELMKTVGGPTDKSHVAAALKWVKLDHQLKNAEREFTDLLDSRRDMPKVDAWERRQADADAEWNKRSLSAVQATVAERLADSTSLPSLSASSNPYTFRTALSKHLRLFQGWACTSMSVGRNFPLKPAMFDLAIIDESSQCSVADILPVAYRAKRIVIAGDMNQLRTITSLGPAPLKRIALNAGLNEQDLSDRGIHHKEGSAYEAFEHAREQVFNDSRRPYLLDEHHRCHPLIAKWFNKAFYHGQLHVLTDLEKHDGMRVLSWKDVRSASRRPQRPSQKGGRRHGGWVNEAQAREVITFVKDAVSKKMTLGVVSPYTAQGELIEHLANKEVGSESLRDAEFVCGTAHKLQGNERDVIVFATTLTPNMKGRAAQWIEANRNLINVAVSRAKHQLIVVGHPQQDAELSITLHDLRDYIKGFDNRPNGANDDGLLEVPAHSVAEQLLLEAMRQKGLAPMGKQDVGGYEVDFSLMQGNAKLNIEVDGGQHLDGLGRQRRSDLARDIRLRRLGWEVLRVPAWRCHHEPSAVATEIEATFQHLAAKLN